MSRAYQLRQQIRERIVDQLTGVREDDVIIDRQHDILSAIATAVATASNGIAITVQPMRATTTDPRSKKLHLDTTIVVTMWTKPLLAGELTDQPEEDVHEALLDALHHHECEILSNDARRFKQRLMVTGFNEVDDPDYLRRDTTIITELLGIAAAA